jgi:hypothetical protein
MFHAPREEGISDGAEEHDGKNDEVFTKRQNKIPVRAKSKQWQRPLAQVFPDGEAEAGCESIGNCFLLQGALRWSDCRGGSDSDRT